MCMCPGHSLRPSRALEQAWLLGWHLLRTMHHSTRPHPLHTTETLAPQLTASFSCLVCACVQLSRKMGKVKEIAISKGKWPGRAGPKGGEEEEKEFREYQQEVIYETKVGCFEWLPLLASAWSDLAGCGAWMHWHVRRSEGWSCQNGLGGRGCG